MSVEKVAEDADTSKDQVRRSIRLNEFEPELQKMVDDGKIGMTHAVEISYLKPDEQKMLIDTIDSEQATPSLFKVQRMKRLSQEGKLNDDTMFGIMLELKNLWKKGAIIHHLKECIAFCRKVSAAASVGASAYGRGVHRTPAPLEGVDDFRSLLQSLR